MVIILIIVYNYHVSCIYMYIYRELYTVWDKIREKY